MDNGRIYRPHYKNRSMCQSYKDKKVDLEVLKGEEKRVVHTKRPLTVSTTFFSGSEHLMSVGGAVLVITANNGESIVRVSALLLQSQQCSCSFLPLRLLFLFLLTTFCYF